MSPHFLPSDPEYRDYALRARMLRARFMAETARRLGRAVVDAVRAYLLWRRRRIAIHDLRRLDDRLLKDIGLSRSQITSVVYGYDDPRPLKPGAGKPGEPLPFAAAAGRERGPSARPYTGGSRAA